MQPQSSDFLSPEKLQLFVASLSGLAPDEVRNAKLLLIKDAISEYEAMRSALESFGQMQGCLSVIPVFWPVIGARRRMMAAQRRLARDRIRNAIAVWWDDLKGERFRLDDEEFTA
jgi:hypothetical protein